MSLFGRWYGSTHVIEVWIWQIYLYAIATTLGVTMNAVILMHMLRMKIDNAIKAHKMLACSIMPPPVAKEVFDMQWNRLQKGQQARMRIRRENSHFSLRSMARSYSHFVFAPHHPHT